MSAVNCNNICSNRTPDQNNDQTSPNEDNPSTDKTQPESEKGLGDNEVEDSEEPDKFNPGLFCVSF